MADIKLFWLVGGKEAGGREAIGISMAISHDGYLTLSIIKGILIAGKQKQEDADAVIVPMGFLEAAGWLLYALDSSGNPVKVSYGEVLSGLDHVTWKT